MAAQGPKSAAGAAEAAAAAKEVAARPDLGGRALDFCGGHYLLDQPIYFPATGGGNIVFTNGALHASSAFPTASPISQMTKC